MNAIRVRDLRKSYGGRPAVAGVDLDVDTGQVFALLGPNGAGKSTTVEILEGLRRRDAGEVSVLGVDPATAPRSWRSAIGIVQQSATDLAEATVIEAVRHFTGYYPDPRDPDEVVELVGLTSQRAVMAGRLSGGQRRRLDVALGIVGRPRLLFLDEPTTGFDPEARRRFWELVRLLAGEGCTILLTTHYLDEVEALADRLVVIDAGRVVAEGTPATLGGRHQAEAVVRWLAPNGPQAHRTARPAALIRELGEAPELTVTRPSLEDVYLELIGR
ncbi:ABC transporter ATP-binding protein [Actinosynnema sp. NPDC047251]|uniref:ABC-type transporter n=1 Tax=Saccharothrix espanaensis (strain ATCC 51144 / DSM 44229 / JCM 9112 / NBRC 15066 / NRRL 15764) TaxID=1179773 RepID=K0JRB7_SACES|nr:ABC transporter ATP-binding protein [Saccharothrix espanaensis]CCH27882.1 ABC-type transporter [Saccharothrix espanaensis DSM 44229]